MTTETIDPCSAENQRIIEQLVGREVLYCVSSLLHHFAKNESALEGSDYDIEDVWGVCSQDDWRTPIEDDPNLEIYEDDYGVQCVRDRSDGSTWAVAGDWQQTAEHFGIDPYRNEALEHWIVTEWAGRKLSEGGEMVGELFGMTIWGRCCSGQAIHLDGVWGELAAEMEILHGQRNDWSK